MVSKSHSYNHDFPSLLCSQAPPLPCVAGAWKKWARVRTRHMTETRMSPLRAPLSLASITSKLLFFFLWGEVLRDNTKNSFPEFICKCTKPAQRQLLLRTTSKRPVGTVFNYKTTYHTLSSSASSSPVRSSSSLSLSSDGSSTTTQNEYSKYRIEANSVH